MGSQKLGESSVVGDDRSVEFMGMEMTFVLMVSTKSKTESLDFPLTFKITVENEGMWTCLKCSGSKGKMSVLEELEGER